MHKKDTYNLAIGLALQELHNEQKLPREKIAEALEMSELERDAHRARLGDAFGGEPGAAARTFRRHLGRLHPARPGQSGQGRGADPIKPASWPKWRHSAF